MREVAPLLADVLAFTHGIVLDKASVEARYAAWDKARSPKKPLAELAATLTGVVLVELKWKDTDQLTFFVLAPDAAKSLASWKRKAGIPLAVVK